MLNVSVLRAQSAGFLINNEVLLDTDLLKFTEVGRTAADAA